VADELLARLRRNALVACGAIALLAFALDPNRPAAALGVLGGGLLIAISYAAVAFTFHAFLPAPGDQVDPANRKRTRTFAVLVFAAHYALLALAAYVMIGRLRLHPVGLLGGVTSFVVAVALEARRPGVRR
jgi:amino acid permease